MLATTPLARAVELNDHKRAHAAYVRASAARGRFREQPRSSEHAGSPVLCANTTSGVASGPRLSSTRRWYVDTLITGGGVMQIVEDSGSFKN